MTEALRRAISLQAFIDAESRRGGKVLIEVGGQIRQIVFPL